MNDKRESWDDEARFDRLVDGEISAADYKALLASLDDEPGGWRRLALPKTPTVGGAFISRLTTPI